MVFIVVAVGTVVFGIVVVVAGNAFAVMLIPICIVTVVACSVLGSNNVIL